MLAAGDPRKSFLRAWPRQAPSTALEDCRGGLLSEETPSRNPDCAPAQRGVPRPKNMWAYVPTPRASSSFGRGLDPALCNPLQFPTIERADLAVQFRMMFQGLRDQD